LLVRDKLGNLYGTTFGAVFKLRAPVTSGGVWTEVTLHHFAGGSSGDGSEPTGEMILIKGAGLYGTTVLGGSKSGGAVFNISFLP
jgi:hypothetical protein